VHGAVGIRQSGSNGSAFHGGYKVTFRKEQEK